MGLDVTEFVMAVEDEFDVRIPDEDWGMLRTVGGMEEYVSRLQVRSGVSLHVPREPSDDIYEQLRVIISRSFNIPTEEIRRDSRFIEDLGLG
jgi:acyl carrier protein